MGEARASSVTESGRRTGNNTTETTSPLFLLVPRRPPAMVGAALCLAVLATVGAETGPLKYDLQECAAPPLKPGTCAALTVPAVLPGRFTDKYVRPGKPNDDPKTKEGHDAYDPFHLPMPTLKTGALRPHPPSPSQTRRHPSQKSTARRKYQPGGRLQGDGQGW